MKKAIAGVIFLCCALTAVYVFAGALSLQDPALVANTASGDTLLSNLRFGYKLDEASGTRASVVNGLTLTDNNTVIGTNMCKVGAYGGRFVASANECLSRNSEANLEFGDIDYTISSWVKLHSTNETTFAWGTSVSGGSEIDWEMGYFKNSGFFTWEYYDNGTAQYYNVIDNSVTNPVLNVWYHVLCQYKADGNIMSIQVNNNPIISTTNAVAQAVHSGGVFTIGTARGVNPANDWNGDIDEVYGWSRLLTDNEKTRLWNHGLGLQYPFGTDSIWTSCVGFWPLTETSGTRNDVIGTSHLTDNNTVTSGNSFLPNYLAGSFAVANMEYLDVADNAATSVGGTDFTLSCWVNPATTVNAPLMAKYTPSGSQRGYAMRLLSGALQFDLGQDDTTYDAVGGGVLGTGAWKHCATTWTESTVTAKVYLDNVEVGSKAFAVSGSYDDAAPFTIGAWSSPSGAGLYQNGLIGNAGLWKRKLSDEELRRLYNHR